MKIRGNCKWNSRADSSSRYLGDGEVFCHARDVVDVGGGVDVLHVLHVGEADLEEQRADEDPGAHEAGHRVEEGLAPRVGLEAGVAVGQRVLWKGAWNE